MYSAVMSELTFPAGHEAHLWNIELDEPTISIERLHAHLDESEQRRAARLRFGHDRRRWILARSAVRQILSRYLGIRPDAVVFHLSPYGKPALGPKLDAQSLHFNLSHSNALAVLAVARCEVGVDVEYMDQKLSWESLPVQVFSAAEQQHLLSHPPHLQRGVFFRLWTLKEAYIKGRGLGLQIPLQSFTVPMLRPCDIGNVCVEPNWDDGRPWRLLDLSTKMATHVGALAFLGNVSRMLWFGWSFAKGPD